MTHCDLLKDGPLKGFDIGIGVNRTAGRWSNMGSLTLPSSAANPLDSGGRGPPRVQPSAGARPSVFPATKAGVIRIGRRGTG